MKIQNLEELDTPCLILDKPLLEKNCFKARKKCLELSTILRPHIKTPKSIEIAKIALDDQIGPITVSTLNEAEYFDPEQGAGTGNLQGIESFNIPSTRDYGVSVKFGF